MLGKFYGIGVGPGDPELLTLKAEKILKAVNVICYPTANIEKPSIAMQIVEGAVKKNWEELKLYLPMTQDEKELEKNWKMAALQVKNVLIEGKDAAFITLGDPSFFSTFTYIMRELRELLPALEIEIIPGISAPNLLAAQAEVPLVEGEEKFVVIPGINNIQEIADVLDSHQNIMFLKVGRKLPEVYELLKERNLENNAVFGSRCGFANSLITKDITSVLEKDRDYLSVLLVKKGGLK